ncbi:MAG: hypothetical protein AB7F78_03180 [Hyphomicrobiaceae bacterium]
MIETDHLGQRIIYSENSDTWQCLEMELQAKSLSALKTKIADALNAARKCDVEAIYFPSFSSWEKAKVTMLVEPDEAWIVHPEGKKMRRRKVKFNELLPDTPESVRLIKEWRDLSAAAESARRAAEAARAAIPRLSPDDCRAREAA